MREVLTKAHLKFSHDEYLRLAYKVARYGEWVGEIGVFGQQTKWGSRFEYQLSKSVTANMYIYSTTIGREIHLWVSGSCWVPTKDETEKIFRALMEREDFGSWVLAKEI